MKKSHSSSQIFEKPSTHRKFSYWPWLIPVLILILYGKTIHFDFAGDDILVTSNNNYVQKGIYGIKDIFTHSYLEGYTAEPDPLYRPLPLVSYAIEKHFFGHKASTYHFFQLLWYVLACFLFFKVLQKINCPEWIMFWSVVLFIIHPIHTEVVCNIKSRDEIMSFCFLMLSLFFFLHSRGLIFSRMYGLSLLFFLLGILSKESTLSMMLLFPVMAYFFFEKNLPKSLIHLVAYALLTILVIFLIRTPFIRTEYSLALIDNSLVAGPDFISRLPTLIILLAKYIVLCIIPYSLSYDYSYPQIPLYGYDHTLFIFAILMLAGIIVVFYYFFNKNMWITLGIIWFFLAISVTSNFLFLHGATFAERFLFSPVAGILLAIAGIAETLTKHKSELKKWVNVGLIIYSVLLVYQSTVYGNTWKNDDQLFKSGILSAPNSARTNMFYGRYWYNLYKRNPTQLKSYALLDSAIRYYNISTDLHPGYTTAWHFKSWAYREKELPDLELTSLQKAYETDSTYYPALLSLAIMNMKKNEFVNAIGLLQKANFIRSNVFDVEYNLGYCYRMLKEFEKAIQHLETAHQINPNRLEPLNQLVKVYRDDVQILEKAKMYNDKIKELQQK